LTLMPVQVMINKVYYKPLDLVITHQVLTSF